MRPLLRLLAFIATLFSFSAYAEVPITQYAGNASGSCAGNVWTTDINAAAAAGTACRNQIYPSPPNASCALTSISGLSLFGTCTFPDSSTITNYHYWTISSRSWCVETNAAAVNGVCVPPVNLCSELTGRSAGTYEFHVNSATGNYQVCETSLSSGDPGAPGCLLNGYSDFGFGTTNPDGSVSWTYLAKMIATGAKCLPDENGSYVPGSPAAEPQPDTTSTCEPPLVRGTVNGQSVCVPVAPDAPIVKKDGGTTTTTASDGTTTAKQESVQTSCTAITCTSTTTITTTVTSPGGQPVTGTETQVGTCTRGAPGCGPDEGEGGAVDTPLGAVPALYEPAYPGGLGAVWSDKKAQLQATPLFSLASGLMPQVGASGECPSFTIPLDVGFVNFGIADLSPPCWLWDFLKAVVIVSALILARSLIFGG